MSPYKQFMVINGVIAGRPYYHTDQMCQESFVHYRSQFTMVVSDCYAIQK